MLALELQGINLSLIYLYISKPNDLKFKNGKAYETNKTSRFETKKAHDQYKNSEMLLTDVQKENTGYPPKGQTGTKLRAVGELQGEVIVDHHTKR